MIPGHLLRKTAFPKLQIFAALILALFGYLIVVTADYLTSYELTLSPLYVLVILAVGWFCGMWWAILFAFLSVFAQIQIGLFLGHQFSEPVYFYISNGNKLFAFLLIAFLTSTVKTLYERAKAAARMDYLTGISNSIGFYEKVSVEMARHRRNRHPFAVAYINCDHLRVINEGLGHSEGDQVLRVIGQTLKSKLRETDIVARLGGDEFALVFPETGEFAALQVINKLRQELDLAMTEHGWPITFSIGVGIFPSVPRSVDRVIAFSDKLMYRVKALGKNKVLHRVYNSEEPDTNPPAQLGVG